MTGYTFDLSADKPYIHSRLMAKADVVSISAGACPDGPIDTATVLEDTSLMGESYQPWFRLLIIRNKDCMCCIFSHCFMHRRVCMGSATGPTPLTV